MTPSPHTPPQTPLPSVKQNSEESLIIQYTPLQLPSSHPLDPERHDTTRHDTARHIITEQSQRHRTSPVTQNPTQYPSSRSTCSLAVANPKALFQASKTQAWRLSSRKPARIRNVSPLPRNTQVIEPRHTSKLARFTP
ncbi:hypothetical protein HDV57DRAFT_486240 [Trichoderma longibrachiatum]|uniref:Uncharacterized protein n=1 Tax=Trichoderma longibrachiatum ATCC 18648 TaxID=983965 RepID=A0A2T4CBM0_TRILO|nr:hypothetical protein M440DRAFT_224857 [Trichoderma longibrachiatum ATCC 18648]